MTDDQGRVHDPLGYNKERRKERRKEARGRKGNPTDSRERFLTVAQGCHSQGSQNGQREEALHGVSVSCEFASVSGTAAEGRGSYTLLAAKAELLL